MQEISEKISFLPLYLTFICTLLILSPYYILFHGLKMTHPGRPGGLLCSWIATPTPGHPPHHHTRQDHTDTNRDTPRAPVLLINHTKTPDTWDRSTPNRTPAGAWWASGGGRGHICPAPRGVGRANRNDCGGESPMKG